MFTHSILSKQKYFMANRHRIWETKNKNQMNPLFILSRLLCFSVVWFVVDDRINIFGSYFYHILSINGWILIVFEHTEWFRSFFFLGGISRELAKFFFKQHITAFKIKNVFSIFMLSNNKQKYRTNVQMKIFNTVRSHQLRSIRESELWAPMFAM